ncbi:ras association domain-containing protein 10 [Eleutherodactylus coqui]|uniref:ras association domain-containing protein 10 n=1 Tax=Eleutherodactylus coqui TaxID=57060 RepID=UPI0034626CAD
MESEEEWKVSVWLCEEEKLVSGLTRRTTCADVVRVLLDDHNENQSAEESMMLGPPQSYCIVEKWRGFERILPNKTKILRLWTAWGEEQENVRFVLVRNEASLPNIGPRSAEAKVVLSRESPCPFMGATKATMALTKEKQRRVVRKAFRKLAKMNKKRQETLSRESNSVEKMETLVHLVLSQDHTIRQQLQRIKDLDRDIDRYEAKIHFDRMKRHGVNYVQDTYLVGVVPDKACDSNAEDKCSEELLIDFEDYARKCEGILLLQDELAQQEALIEQITAQIQEELNKRWMDRRQEELSSKDQDPTTTSANEEECENELLLEQERVKTELSASLYIGLRLNTDLEAIKVDLDYSQQVWNEKESELQSLLDNIGALEVAEEQDTCEELRPGCSQVVERTCTEGSGVWVEKDMGQCNCEGNDEDSDTGLSSMHSQDSDSTPVCESLV